MKKLLYIIVICLLFTECQILNNKDQLASENSLVIIEIIQADTIIEKDYKILKQPSYDISIVAIRSEELKIGFRGRLFNIPFTDYFELSDTSTINRQLEIEQEDIWNTYNFHFYQFIDSEELKSDNFSWEKIYTNNAKGFQILSIPVYNKTMDRALFFIEKYCGIDNCNETNLVILNKEEKDWSIEKVIEL